MVDEDELFDVLAVSLCLVALLGYTFFSYVMTILFPTSSFKTQLARNTANSFVFVRKHRDRSDAASVTLAIQTFRNTILTAIFVGGISFQSAISLTSLYPDTDTLPKRLRLLILSFTLFSSFLCWASVIRSGSHLGYLTGILSYDDHPATPTTPAPSTTMPSTEAKKLTEMTNMAPTTTAATTTTESSPMPTHSGESTTEARLHQVDQLMYIMLLSFSLGFRFLFISIPFFLYAAGPEILVITTFLLLVFMYCWDHFYTFTSVDTAIKKAS